MNKISTQLSDKSILDAIEKNLDDFYIKSSAHENYDSKITDMLSWVLAKESDWPSCIFKVNFKETDMNNQIVQVMKSIKNEIAPNNWTIGPLSIPKDLGNILINFGFSEVYHQSGMAVDLLTMIKKTKDLGNLTVERVRSKESSDIWANLVSEVFGIKVDKDFIKYLQAQNEARLYLGYQGDKPVSTLLLYLSAGVAGLHAVTTLPEYRGQGFGYSISRHSLQEAYKMGYKIGVLQASSLGQLVYRKLGFVKLCDIYTYALPDID